MIYVFREHHGRDRMEVGFTTTCAISAYHYRSCEFESHSWFTMNGIRTHNFEYASAYSIQHYVIKFVSYLRQVGGFLRLLQFSSPPHYVKYR
jgi:hypothetical protein